MEIEAIFLVCLVCLFLIALIRGEFFNRDYFTMRNMGVNLLGTVSLGLSRIVMTFVIGGALSIVFPGQLNFLAHDNVYLVFVVYILVQDYLHYWLHRLAHTNERLWQLHKVHHSPTTIDVTVSNRNPFIWWCMIPHTWLGCMLVWAGMPEVVAVASLISGVVSLFAHMTGRWDLVLFNNPITRPFMWLLSRFISVPDTHHYHHNLDGGNSNFSTLFMFWDMLHGTAEFPEKKISGFGLYDQNEEDEWHVQVFQPFVPRKKMTKSSDES